MRGRLLIALVGLVASLASVSASADDPQPGTPGWYAAETGNWLASTGRTRDQLTNPDYVRLREGQADTTNADPYRAPEVWAPARGRVWAVSYRNRYGARISAHVWAPRAAGRHPGVVVVNGAGDSEEEYWSFAQDLAEHGYVVLTFDPQGAGRSDADPAPRYCDPQGAWRRPQEMGVTEHGSCAGQNEAPATGEVPGVVSIVVSGHTGQQGTLDIQDLYEQLEPNFVFGALDARDYLASGADPALLLLDTRRIGVIGHSLGAYAAALTANGDPKHRFRVGVAMDSYAVFMHHVGPRVPTLYLQSEQELFSGPRLMAPPPTGLHATRRDYAAFVRRGLPVAYAVLAGSTHHEFAYLGPEAHLPASSAGQRVASYYVLAWLDRWLKGDRAATRRLLATTFDRSVDRSSIGLGHWDPVSRQNQPYLIGGTRVADALSRYYLSTARFDGRSCPDLRRRC
jgi:dienelactone hydrolase